VSDTVRIDTTLAICQENLPWVWNGITINEAGIHTKILQTNSGCDSTVVLTVTVHPTIHNPLADTTLCEHTLPFQWNGQTISAVGTHELTYTGTSSKGCDSIVKRTFIVVPTEIISLPDLTVCFEALPFTWKNKTISQPGEHLLSDTISSANTACLEITQLKVEALSEKRTVFYDTLCETELPYTWNGHTISSTGDTSLLHIQKSVEHPLCDSIIENKVHVYPTKYRHIDSTICEQQIEHVPFLWNGQQLVFDSDQPQNHRGSHQYSYTTQSSITHCDSITTLTLWVDTTVRKDTTLFFCWKDKPGSWNGHSLASPGYYKLIDTFPSLLTGCDSILTAHITIDDPPPHVSYNTCESEIHDPNNPFINPFTGEIVTSVGVYHSIQEAWTSNAGCEDVKITSWSIIPYGSVNILDTSLHCSPIFPITWRGKTFTDYTSVETFLDADGFYRDSVYTGSGECTSVNIYRLWIEMNTHTDEIDTVICQSNIPFTWRNFSISNPTSGTILRDTVKQVATIFPDSPLFQRCDSIYICNLTVNPKVYYTHVQTVCDNELPYEWNSLLIDTVNFTNGYLDTTIVLKQIETECDSVVTLQLTLYPVQRDTLPKIEICYEQLPYTWKEHTITQADIGEVELTHTTLTHLGCDSVVTFYATVYPKIFYDVDTIGLCYEELPYTWKDTTITEAGFYTIVRTESSLLTGCDSTITAVIIVNDVVMVSLPDSTICTVNLPFQWNDTTITAQMGEGVYLFTAQLERYMTNCDSTVQLSITVHSSLTTTISDTLHMCYDDLPSGGYTWFENTIIDIGTHTLQHDTVSKVTACDSVITRVAVVHPSKTSKDSLHLCDSDLPFTWFDRTIVAPGRYDTTLYVKYIASASDGNSLLCDSVAKHVLVVGETRYRTDPPQIICESDTASFSWHGKTIQQTGTLYDTFLSPIGCDSIISIAVTVVPTIKEYYADSIACEEDLPFIWHNEFINEIGEYDLEHTTIVPSTGCLKVEYIHFVGKEMDKAFLFDTICETDLPYHYGSITITTLPIPHTQILERHDPKLNTGCDSMTVTALTVVPTPITTIDSTICEYELPNFIWNGLTAEDIDFQVLTHTSLPTLPKDKKSTCDSVTILNLTVQRNPTVEKKDLTCYQVNEGEITINPPPTFLNYSFEWTNYPNHSANFINNLPQGTYEVYAIHQRCTTLHTVEITEPSPLVVTSIDSETLCFEDYTGSATVEVSGGTTPYFYSWNDPNNQTAPTATNLLVGTYVVTVTDGNNCQTTEEINITKPPQLELSMMADSVRCFGEKNGATHVVASGGTLPYSYLWNDVLAQTTSTASNLAIGTYTVVVTDDNNCQKTADITVWQPDSLVIELSKEDVVCFGENNGSASVVVYGGSAPYTFLWTDPNIQTTQNATLLFAGTYEVVVNDDNDCKARDSITISQPEKLVMSVSNDTTICPYDYANLTATYSGGVAPITIDWGNGQTSWELVAQPSVDTIYTPIITDAHLCTDSRPIAVKVVALPIVHFNDQPVQGCPPLSVHFDNLSIGTFSHCQWSFRRCITSVGQHIMKSLP